jgi:hypothetical protein
MIFSNDQSTETGQGWIVEFKKRRWGRKTLEKEALALADAEGIGTQTITGSWGAVGIFVNDRGAQAEQIKTLWRKCFEAKKSSKFTYSNYCFEGEEPVIDQSGFLQINPSLEDFDFLMATATVPDPRQPLTPQQIAEQMNQREYATYFKTNKAFGISTFQDDTITKLLNI